MKGPIYYHVLRNIFALSRIDLQSFYPRESKDWHAGAKEVQTAIRKALKPIPANSWIYQSDPATIFTEAYKDLADEAPENYVCPNRFAEFCQAYHDGHVDKKQRLLLAMHYILAAERDLDESSKQ